jgi:tRNA threonylcarbamoyladenosine biosynthesis protein TsaE
MRIVLRTPTAEDTRAVGGALATLLEPGDAIALTGELGAGKTTLVQGLARGLGATDTVLSPTFTLVREYRSGRLPLVHADVYRLERMQEVIDLGLEDEWERDGVLAIEWGDAVDALLPGDRITVELRTIDPASEERRIALDADGERWAGRWDGLSRELQSWWESA